MENRRMGRWSIIYLTMGRQDLPVGVTCVTVVHTAILFTLKGGENIRITRFGIFISGSENHVIRSSKLYGLYTNMVDGLSLTNVSIECRDSMKPYASEEMHIRKTEHVRKRIPA